MMENENKFNLKRRISAFWGKNGKKGQNKLNADNKGFTLVELLCTVAILGVISATIGGVLMVSARTYQSGTVESALQQEAQFTANRIAGLIVDATENVRYYYESAGGYTEVKSDAEIPNSDTCSKQLEIANGSGTGSYLIIYDNVDSQLNYIEIAADGTASSAQLLAENVTGFKADVSTFSENRNVGLTLEFTVGNKSYEVDYNITSRNGSTTAVASPSSKWAYVNIDPADIIIEPAETYIMDVNVQGSSQGFTCTLSGNSSGDTKAIVYAATNQIYIKAGASETGDGNGNMYLTITTNEKKADGVTPLASRVATFHVRRVYNVNASVTLKANTALMQDAEYVIKAKADGKYLDRKLSAVYDNNYVNPYYVKWNYEYTIDGEAAEFDEYFEIIEAQEDDKEPYLKLKLKKDMAGKSILTVKATAKHPEGTIEGIQTNKSGIKYGTVEKTVVIEQPDDDTPTPPTPSYTELSDIKRGQDYHFNDAWEVTNKANGVSANQWNWFYRICCDENNNGVIDADESWTMYYKTQEGGSAKKYNAQETAVMLPQYGYFLEYIYVGYDSGNKQIKWPYDESLLESGNGFYECSYTKGWSNDKTAMSQDDYTTRYYVPKVKATFKANESLGIAEGAVTAGTKGSPINYTGTELIFDFNEVAIEKAHFNYGIEVQRLNGDTDEWEEAELSDSVVQQSNDCYRVHNANGVFGLYRIGMTLKYNRVTQLSGDDAFNPVYTSMDSQIYKLYDWNTETGVIYIYFNK